MRFKKHLEFEYSFRNIEIVAAVNLLFVILLFFICILNFAAEPGIRADLGRVFPGNSLMRGNVEISLMDDKSVVVNGRSISDDEFTGMLKFAALHKQAVLIKVAQGIPLGRVISIMNKCRNFGVRQVNILTQK